MDNWGVPGRCWPAPHGRASSFFRLFFQGLLRVLFVRGFSWSPGAPMVSFEPILESFGLPFAAYSCLRWTSANVRFTETKHCFLRFGRVPGRVCFVLFFHSLSFQFVFVQIVWVC